MMKLHLLEGSIEEFIKGLFDVVFYIEVKKIGIHEVVERFYTKELNNLTKLKVRKGRRVEISLVMVCLGKQKYLPLMDISADEFNNNFTKLKKLFDEIIKYCNKLLFRKLASGDANTT